MKSKLYAFEKPPTLSVKATAISQSEASAWNNTLDSFLAVPFVIAPGHMTVCR